MKCSNCGKRLRGEDIVYYDKRYTYTCCSTACLLYIIADYNVLTVNEYKRRFPDEV